MQLSRRGFVGFWMLSAPVAMLATIGWTRRAVPGDQRGPVRAAEPTTIPGFAAFQSTVMTLADERFLYVASDGMPAHAMMVGIRSWQQQVPLPQPYSGDNAWRIPRHGMLAEQPISGRDRLFRGAIALAVNGVPVFNARNNRGEDAYLAGELDEWGGHPGRADDYHYHVAPLHLQVRVGAGDPIAYALDGFPIYGLTEPDGSPARSLDDLNGHQDAADGYHYHATTGYPYINGGLRGVIDSVWDDQVEPQPRTTPIRQALEPLRGATVTGFEVTGPDAYALTYHLGGQPYVVAYRREGSAYLFDFTSPSGQTRSERYGQQRAQPKPERGGGR